MYSLVPDADGEPGGVVLYGDKEIGSVTKEVGDLGETFWQANEDSSRDEYSSKKRAFKSVCEEHRNYLAYVKDKIAEYQEMVDNYG